MALGALGGLTSLAGTIGGMFASGSAANALKDAAANTQGYINDTAQNATGYLSPYTSMGTAAANQLTSQLPSLSQGFNPTMAQLEQTPGYQFAQQQGLESTQNSYAARGLGVSGAALKGAANYATGLADQTYTNQANIYNQNRTTSASILTGATQLGQQAAETAGGYLMDTIAPYASAEGAYGNASAAGIMAPWTGLTALGSSLSGQGASGMGAGALGNWLSGLGGTNEAAVTSAANNFTQSNPQY